MRVIVWSGGADSTLLLAHALKESRAKTHVAAITLRHHQLVYDREPMRRSEHRARENFKRWARDRRYRFEHHTVSVSSKIWCPNEVGQYSLWASHLILGAGSIWPNRPADQIVDVEFGYIKRDIFWHLAHRFVTAVNAIADLAQLRLRPTFPLEWYEKKDVLDGLHQLGVPRSCWWTCESPKGTRACRKCSKCLEVAGWKRPEPVSKKALYKSVSSLKKAAQKER